MAPKSRFLANCHQGPALPSLYVSDPTYKFTGTDPSLNMREIAFRHNASAAAKLEEELLLLMRARNTVRQSLLKD